MDPNKERAMHARAVGSLSLSGSIVPPVPLAYEAHVMMGPYATTSAPHPYSVPASHGLYYPSAWPVTTMTGPNESIVSSATLHSPTSSDDGEINLDRDGALRGSALATSAQKTLFIAGFPADVKEREIFNLLRFQPGFLDCSLTPSANGKQAIAFASWQDHESACRCRDALQGLRFDPYGPPTYLRIQFARTESKSRRLQPEPTGMGSVSVSFAGVPSYPHRPQGNVTNVLSGGAGAMATAGGSSSGSVSTESGSSSDRSSGSSNLASSPTSGSFGRSYSASGQHGIRSSRGSSQRRYDRARRSTLASVSPRANPSLLEEPESATLHAKVQSGHTSDPRTKSTSSYPQFSSSSPIASTSPHISSYPTAPLSGSPTGSPSHSLHLPLNIATPSAISSSPASSASSSSSLDTKAFLHASHASSSKETKLKDSIQNRASQRCSTLFVTNLSMLTTEPDLLELFDKFPGFSKLRFQLNTEGAPIAFVDFINEEFSSVARTRLQGVLLHHTPLRIEFAKQQMKRPRRR